MSDKDISITGLWSLKIKGNKIITNIPRPSNNSESYANISPNSQMEVIMSAAAYKCPHCSASIPRNSAKCKSCSTLLTWKGGIPYISQPKPSRSIPEDPVLPRVEIRNNRIISINGLPFNPDSSLHQWVYQTLKIRGLDIV